MVLASAVSAGFVGWLWAALIAKYTGKLIWLTFGSLVAAQIAFAVWVMFFSAAPEINGMGILIFIGSGFTMLFGVLMRRWVPLCTALFNSAVQVHVENPSLSRVIHVHPPNPYNLSRNPLAATPDTQRLGFTICNYNFILYF